MRKRDIRKARKEKQKQRDQHSKGIKMKFATAALMILASSPALAAWEYKVRIDQMTDERTCTGYLVGEGFKVQLNDGHLFLVADGTPRGITLRFDNNPAMEMRLPSDTEKSIRAVSMTPSEVARAVASSRIRAEIVTYTQITSYDLDVAGISEAYRHVSNGCEEAI